jgi:hypothetical protein
MESAVWTEREQIYSHSLTILLQRGVWDFRDFLIGAFDGVKRDILPLLRREGGRQEEGIDIKALSLCSGRLCLAAYWLLGRRCV